jgi:hypothetical protein
MNIVQTIGNVADKVKEVITPKANKGNTPEQDKLVHQITTNQTNAESVRKEIETIWDDENKIYQGGGKQWETSIAYRSQSTKKIRPNSEDNFVFNTIENLKANLTASTPEPSFSGVEETDQAKAEELTYLARFNDTRNNFRATWKKMVLDFVSYGPIIGMISWDPDWMGGTGPNKWIGDIRISRVDRRDIFFDPAITDLEERLQECSFIHRRIRKKVSWIKKKWKDTGKNVTPDSNDNEHQNEGSDPNQVWLIESWMKGKPAFVPEEFKKEFLRKANEAEAQGYSFEAQDYRDMANGTLEGVHVCYVANNTFLEYIPYIYEDGQYPVIYKTCYFDENNPAGFGEIRNIKIPQIMHNKADEIEIEAMTREGLGGKYYKKGAVSDAQLKNIQQSNSKAGAWLEVNNINDIHDREGVRVPASVPNYKEHKQRIIETVSSVTPIQQGMSPGANVPYSTIKELGARTDTRTKAKVEILEDFLIELNKMRLNRFKQFYTEYRYYRLKMPDGVVKEGTFNANKVMNEWGRETGEFDELGNPIVKKERYVPEFDIDVKIMDEKPTDRNYYTSTAFSLLPLQGITIEDVWYTLEEGKFPPKDDVLEHLKNQNIALQITSSLNQMAPEQQQAFFNAVQQLAQGVLQQQVMQVQQPQMAQGGTPNGQM